MACKYSDPFLSAVNHTFDLHGQEIILDVYLINELLQNTNTQYIKSWTWSFFPH